MDGGMLEFFWASFYWTSINVIIVKLFISLSYELNSWRIINDSTQRSLLYSNFNVMEKLGFVKLEIQFRIIYFKSIEIFYTNWRV